MARSFLQPRRSSTRVVLSTGSRARAGRFRRRHGQPGLCRRSPGHLQTVSMQPESFTLSREGEAAPVTLLPTSQLPFQAFPGPTPAFRESDGKGSGFGV